MAANDQLLAWNLNDHPLFQDSGQSPSLGSPATPYKVSGPSGKAAAKRDHAEGKSQVAVPGLLQEMPAQSFSVVQMLIADAAREYDNARIKFGGAGGANLDQKILSPEQTQVMTNYIKKAIEVGGKGGAGVIGDMLTQLRNRYGDQGYTHPITKQRITHYEAVLRELAESTELAGAPASQILYMLGSLPAAGDPKEDISGWVLEAVFANRPVGPSGETVKDALVAQVKQARADDPAFAGEGDPVLAAIDAHPIWKYEMMAITMLPDETQKMFRLGNKALIRDMVYYMLNNNPGMTIEEAVPFTLKAVLGENAPVFAPKAEHSIWDTIWQALPFDDPVVHETLKSMGEDFYNFTTGAAKWILDRLPNWFDKALVDKTRIGQFSKDFASELQELDRISRQQRQVEWASYNTYSSSMTNSQKQKQDRAASLLWNLFGPGGDFMPPTVQPLEGQRLNTPQDTAGVIALNNINKTFAQFGIRPTVRDEDYARVPAREGESAEAWEARLLEYRVRQQVVNTATDPGIIAVASYMYAFNPALAEQVLNDHASALEQVKNLLPAPGHLEQLNRVRANILFDFVSRAEKDSRNPMTDSFNFLVGAENASALARRVYGQSAEHRWDEENLHKGERLRYVSLPDGYTYFQMESIRGFFENLLYDTGEPVRVPTWMLKDAETWDEALTKQAMDLGWKLKKALAAYGVLGTKTAKRIYGKLTTPEGVVVKIAEPDDPPYRQLMGGPNTWNDRWEFYRWLNSDE